MNKKIESKFIEIEIANANKPISYSNNNYPLNSLNDRVFEILIYSIFKLRNENENSVFHEFCDDVYLMQGIGEKGMDCILSKNNKTSGIIQCKKYSKNLNPTIILKEITKFALHYYLNASVFVTASKLKYFLVTSTGFSGNAIKLIQQFKNKSFIENLNFDIILRETINKYKEFDKISANIIKNEIINLISKFKYTYINPQDIDIWINSYPVLIETFFEIKKVTDNKLIFEKSNEILKKLDSMTSKKDEEGIENFITNYSKIAIEKLNTINFIGFDLNKHRQKPTDITLTELYVQPNFKQRVLDKNKKVTSISDHDLKIANIFKSEKNIVILGDPGAGKSLFVKYLIVQILSRKASSIGMLNYEAYLPFRITLRKYYEVRTKLSFIQYLSEVYTHQYQIPISYKLLEKILTKRKCLLFFDGLDEIFNIQHKNQIKDLIEAFSLSHPNVKCIVTSRFIGYHDVKFKPDKFDEFAIKQLSDDQINELVNKFYTTQHKNLSRRNSAIASFLSQLEKDIDDELKCNPLILTLILILASNNIVIPDSKLEIYESCTKTLVESIDSKEKELNLIIPVKNKRITFASLAYWQYESISNGDKVFYDKTKKKLIEFFLERKEVEEYVEAEDKAEKFLEYAERRSIYFEDNFTHKTFLEYFTADYLYINYFTKASDASRKELLKIVTKYLSNPYWYIVFELLFSRIDSEQADCEVMDDFLLKQLSSGSIDVFYFLICNISSYTNVSDNIRESIIKKTIELCIKGEKTSHKSKFTPFEENNIVSKINKLTFKELFFKIIQQLIYEFEDTIKENSKLIDFYNFYYELTSFFDNQTNKLQIKNIRKIEELSQNDHYLFSNYHLRYGIKNINPDTLISQVENFGIKSLFKDINFKFRENVTRINTFDIFFIQVIENTNYDIFNSTLNKLFKVGLKDEMVINHVKESRVLFFHRANNFKSLIDLFLVSENNLIDKLIISIIKRMPENRNLYLKYRTENNHKKLKILDKIINATSR